MRFTSRYSQDLVRSCWFILIFLLCAEAFSANLCRTTNAASAGAFLSEYEREPAVYRRLEIPEHTAGTYRTPEAAYEAYLIFRLRGYAPAYRRRILEELGNAEIHYGRDFTGVQGAYAPRRGRIRMYVNSSLEGTAYFYAGLLHELEHVIQHHDLNYAVVPSEEHYCHEFGAVRAEWEYLRMLSEDTRALAIRDAVDLEPGIFGRDGCQKRMAAVKEGFGRYREEHVYSSRAATAGYY